MLGDLVSAWPDSWAMIWGPLRAREDVPADLFCELYRELTAVIVDPPSIEDLADIVDSPGQSRDAFASTSAAEITGEEQLAGFFEAAFDVMEDLGGDELSNDYFGLLSGFLDRFNLRYDLRRPCELCPTVPGVFTGLFGMLKSSTAADSHLHELMLDFEAAIRELRRAPSASNIKTCISKQTNLLEALGSIHPGVSASTLGAISDQVGSFPHDSVKDSLKAIYRFACDYPGIRHAGSPANAVRPIELRDVVALSIVLVGFSPYLTDRLAADAGYWIH